jgi:hypothetical protein
VESYWREFCPGITFSLKTFHGYQYGPSFLIVLPVCALFRGGRYQEGDAKRVLLSLNIY